jgi:hypothetical protein
MKKEIIINVRITSKIKETIQSLADRDERPFAWMIRKLILEPLEARMLLMRDPF